MHCSLMVDIFGHKLDNVERKILWHPLVGAVILFTRNFKDQCQLANLVKEVRSIKPNIIIAVDQEGGYIQRLQREGFRALPSPRVLGEFYEDNAEAGMKAAHRYGRIMAAGLLACDIDLSLGPVIDLYNAKSEVIGGLDRAFHENPFIVAKLAGAYIDGMNAAGMVATGKHFPGHGSQLDSHITKPVDAISYEHLIKNDLKPFELLIRKEKLHAVMPAHVTNLQVDKDNPAGYSAIWLQEILRKRFGFKGLIISDCLSMAGADIGDLETRAQRAFAAGCNMAIVANQPRAILLALLEFLQASATQEVDPYLRNFKEEMQRMRANFSFEPALQANTLWKKNKQAAPMSSIQGNSMNRTTGI